MCVFLCRTPPFSSEEEADEDDIKQLYISSELLEKQSKTSTSKGNASQMASDKSDMDGAEESEIEEIETPTKTSKGFCTTFYTHVLTGCASFCICWCFCVRNITKAGYLVLCMCVCNLLVW